LTYRIKNFKRKVSYKLIALHNPYFLNEDRLFFSSKAPGLVFSTPYLRGSFAPSALPQNILGPAVSPINTLRKDSALPPVTSEKHTLVTRVAKIVRFCKGLKLYKKGGESINF